MKHDVKQVFIVGWNLYPRNFRVFNDLSMAEKWVQENQSKSRYPLEIEAIALDDFSTLPTQI